MKFHEELIYLNLVFPSVIYWYGICFQPYSCDILHVLRRKYFEIPVSSSFPLLPILEVPSKIYCRCNLQWKLYEKWRQMKFIWLKDIFWWHIVGASRGVAMHMCPGRLKTIKCIIYILYTMYQFFSNISWKNNFFVRISPGHLKTIRYNFLSIDISIHIIFHHTI